jgi:phosphatidylserine/phosphatidylglycerophosphate/cardiolipin synthase-like enzyme
MVGLLDRPGTSTEAQYEYDEKFFRIYDRKQSVAGELNRRYVISDDFPKDTLIFTSRSFSSADSQQISDVNYVDQGLSSTTKRTLRWLPTHHQKMVVVDHEDPAAAVGFVMGHNMLDAYWDTPDHGWKPSPANLGRNGPAPRHDYSSRVTGPIVGDLFRNFSSAWQRETGQALKVPDFDTYPTRDGDRAICQILRTQVQFGHRQDIMNCYLQAVSNATQYIHIENQYFRWPPLADKIKACAARQTAWGRTPEQNGSLYLFIITNTSEEGMGDGTVNTYRMLDSLGRADALPEVARDQRLKDIDAQLAQNEKAMKPLLARREALDGEARMLGGMGGEGLNDRYAAINDRLAPLEARQQQLTDAKARLSPLTWRERTFGSDRTPEAIKQADIPGLKVQVATLVSPDTPAGLPWQEVYIHAKLMLIDDTFMTLGSANINTRSMQTDSELNIAHHRPEITGPLRAQQWAKYTGGAVTEGMPLSDAYQQWDRLMTRNATRKSLLKQPVAQLAEFLRTSDKISNKD